MQNSAAQPSNASFFAYWKQDLPAALVVFLVALPLCLGIAMASGAPLVSGLIAGIVGGIVVGALSKSSLSVAGPAAGLTVIVLDALNALPGYDAFLLAVFLAGLIQIGLGAVRAGAIGDFIPSPVINGMLAAIGLILILKQIPHAFGYDVDYIGDLFFEQADGDNTFTALRHVFSDHIAYGAALIALPSLAFLFWWDKKQPTLNGWLRYVPGPLVAVVAGVLAAKLFNNFIPALAVTSEHMVSVPEIGSLEEFGKLMTFPNFSLFADPAIWMTALTLALVASVETLLSIEAVDRLDPYKRTTPANRELLAQGVGNACSGLVGGLPVTSVIVRSSANVSAGGRTKLSTITHALLLLVCVAAVPWLLNAIPLASLAAILLALGYKLAAPRLFVQKYKDGLRRFIPFVVTIGAILVTDLLTGVGVGVAVCVLLLLIDNFRATVALVKESDAHYVLRLNKDVFFTHKARLKKALASVPNNSELLLDISQIDFVDRDNADIINRFIENAKERDIHIRVKTNKNDRINSFFDLKGRAAAT